MLEQARQIIRDVLAEAKHPCVMWSAGKDSQLLLTLVHEVNPTVPAIWFQPEDKRFAKQMILEQNMEVWSWEPADVYVLPNEGGLSLVREQSFGEHRFPVVMDIEEGTKCIGDFFPERTLQLYPHWDAIFLGYKESDYHWVLGGSGFCPADGWLLGRSKVYAPLRQMQDSEVWQAIKELNVPYNKERYDNGAPDDSTLFSCSRCLQEGEGEVFCLKEQKMISRIEWQPNDRVKEFRQRFQLKDVA